jgi:hypothetical protein
MTVQPPAPVGDIYADLIEEPEEDDSAEPNHAGDED